MPRFAANLSMLFTELPFLDRFEAASKAGFTGVEILFPYAWPVDEISSALNDNGLQLALFNISPGNWDAGERGLTALKGRERDFEAAVEQAIVYADALGCLRLHAMAGLVGHGTDTGTYVANLAKAARLAEPRGIEILIEPINTFDMPDYFLTRTADARTVITTVERRNLCLQLDLYHRHRMEGGAAQAIREYADITRHYQIAGPPDRCEPDHGELDYTELFKIIDDTGYGGWVGCEYKPRAGTLRGLGWVEKLGCLLSGDIV